MSGGRRPRPIPIGPPEREPSLIPHDFTEDHYTRLPESVEKGRSRVADMLIRGTWTREDLQEAGGALVLRPDGKGVFVAVKPERIFEPGSQKYINSIAYSSDFGEIKTGISEVGNNNWWRVKPSSLELELFVELTRVHSNRINDTLSAEIESAARRRLDELEQEKGQVPQDVERVRALRLKLFPQ